MSARFVIWLWASMKCATLSELGAEVSDGDEKSPGNRITGPRHARL